MAAGNSRLGVLGLIGPGLLVAATGVGAGDLATAGFAGSKLGAAVLWAVALGALLKYVLTEGLTRWQLATGETFLEGAILRLGRAAGLMFLCYLLPWSFFVGAALISACGVTAHAILPIFDDVAEGKLLLGAAHSALGLALALTGGYRLVERVMAACIAVMFVAVISTAILMQPDPNLIATGLLIPRIPDLHSGGLTWTVALMGGVGGTLTIICYGYWIRERGRTSSAALGTCRIDLATGYTATALFGMSMVVIASGLKLDGSGASLIIGLADQLAAHIGKVGRWMFLVGAWTAVFSSLLGVWQAVPYVFADFWRLHGMARGRAAGTALSARVDTASRPYRLYLFALASVPMLQVGHPFREVQQYYAVIGAAFIPLLALALLIMNGKRAWVGVHRNRPATALLLCLTLLLSLVAGYLEVWH